MEQSNKHSASQTWFPTGTDKPLHKLQLHLCTQERLRLHTSYILSPSLTHPPHPIQTKIFITSCMT